ncbi:MAG: HepT-like ribonuclease domain-containing protein [Mariprofundales bacterium]
MSDRELLSEILDQILEGIHRIERRFCGIESSDDFLNNENGLDRLDGISMMLIVIGESLKNFERSGGAELMQSHPEVDWKGAKGVRDFLSHHYFDIDAEVVFSICTDRIRCLKQAISTMKLELTYECDDLAKSRHCGLDPQSRMAQDAEKNGFLRSQE